MQGIYSVDMKMHLFVPTIFQNALMKSMHLLEPVKNMLTGRINPVLVRVIGIAVSVPVSLDPLDYLNAFIVQFLEQRRIPSAFIFYTGSCQQMAQYVTAHGCCLSDDFPLYCVFADTGSYPRQLLFQFIETVNVVLNIMRLFDGQRGGFLKPLFVDP